MNTSKPISSYLESVKANKFADPITVDFANGLWRSLHDAYPGLPEPDAAPGVDGQVGLAFDDGCNHLSFDVRPDGTAEAFYVNRSTMIMDDQEFTIGKDRIDGILPEKVRIFTGVQS